MPDLEFDVAILGAGPAGLSAAARAAQRKLSHIVLEAGARHANTIQQYQRRKHVMSEPGLLPLRSDIAFAAGRREAVLQGWEDGIRKTNAQIRYQAEVTAISGAKGAFRLALKDGDALRAGHVIMALGVQGNPRRLEVPGGELSCVQTALESADAYLRETIIVVGAGDAAIENALALAVQNRVILVNRGADFPRAKDSNVTRLTRALDAGRLECSYRAAVKLISAAAAESAAPYQVVLGSPEGERTVDCHRVIARLGAIAPRRFVESIGVRFLDDRTDAIPDLSPQYESSVPGLFIIGALAGCPLIKQAMNQGYEVIEHLSGNPIQPADHPVLEAKLRPLLGGREVAATLDLIQDRVPTFAGLKALAMRELVLASKIVTPRKGRRIFARGDYSSSVFHVLQGQVQLEADAGEPMLLRAGQLFGEMSLISGRPHEIGAVAGPECMLLETPHGTIKKLARTEASVRSYIDRVFVVRALRLLLLPRARAETIHALAVRAQIHSISAGDTLFEQGDPIDRLYLLRSGSVTLSRPTRSGDGPVAYCAAGSFVDVAGCVPGARSRTVTARATVAADALSIDFESFSELLSSDEALQRKVQVEQEQQAAAYARMKAQPEAGDVLSFLMSHGVGEATNVLVIDEQLCIGCDQCEKACAHTHEGVSRLNRRAGPSFYSLHLPTSCRHCEHPHCMRDCPPNAIHRLPDGEVFIDDTCIGCGNCEESCPYGVIQMAEVPERVGIVQRLLGRRPAEAAKTAVKCDMCKDLNAGPACVSACPTGAAIRIHAEDVVALARTRASAVR
ncbi:MAG: cyclic nucleotide-binding protein [Gammaproteobacteria bacterium]|nr:cyclic nucleotide-binding protein [Gammaproteobacteria bacterium]